MDNKKEIGKRIKAIRISSGLTMEEFGKLFTPHATKGTVSNWENGKYLPNNNRLSTIAYHANVDMDFLLYGKNNFDSLDTIPKAHTERDHRSSEYRSQQQNLIKLIESLNDYDKKSEFMGIIDGTLLNFAETMLRYSNLDENEKIFFGFSMMFIALDHYYDVMTDDNSSEKEIEDAYNACIHDIQKAVVDIKAYLYKL